MRCRVQIIGVVACLVLAARIGQKVGEYVAHRHHEQKVAKALASAPAPPEGWEHNTGPDGGFVRKKAE